MCEGDFRSELINRLTNSSSSVDESRANGKSLLFYGLIKSVEQLTLRPFRGLQCRFVHISMLEKKRKRGRIIYSSWKSYGVINLFETY